MNSSAYVETFEEKRSCIYALLVTENQEMTTNKLQPMQIQTFYLTDFKTTTTKNKNWEKIINQIRSR